MIIFEVDKTINTMWELYDLRYSVFVITNTSVISVIPVNIKNKNYFQAYFAAILSGDISWMITGLA